MIKPIFIILSHSSAMSLIRNMKQKIQIWKDLLVVVMSLSETQKHHNNKLSQFI